MYNGYTFESPRPHCKYVKALEYVNAHPGCSRDEICHNALGRMPWESTRGWCSTMFAAMLHEALLTIKSRGKYYVEWRGRAVLQKVNRMLADRKRCSPKKTDLWHEDAV